MAWFEKIELHKAIGKANDKFDLSRQEEEMPKQAAKWIADELMKSFMLSHHAERVLKSKSIAAVNRILQEVFDDADRHRVWCGMPGF